MNEYTEKAEIFLKDRRIKFSASYLKHGAKFNDDQKRGVERDIWRLTLRREKHNMSVRFGNSEHASDYGNTAPSAYDLLACLTKNDPGAFEDFCADFGYTEDSRTALKTWKACCREYVKVEAFFTTPELEELQDIN